MVSVRRGCGSKRMGKCSCRVAKKKGNGRDDVATVWHGSERMGGICTKARVQRSGCN